jgi:hypothetical protein
MRQHQGSINFKGECTPVKSISASPKKPYQKPTLRVYGDIKELTKAISNVTGATDFGGSGSMIKTI